LASGFLFSSDSIMIECPPLCFAVRFIVNQTNVEPRGAVILHVRIHKVATDLDPTSG
jgi:hypothetical protein